jgi:hypothetical protein
VLPDGIFSNQNFQFGYVLEGLGMIFGVFNGHWEHVMVIWNILWPNGDFATKSPRFGILYHEKSGNPGTDDCFEA